MCNRYSALSARQVLIAAVSWVPYTAVPPLGWHLSPTGRTSAEHLPNSDRTTNPEACIRKSV